MGEYIIKPGPLNLVKRIIILEVLMSIILFSASFLANYETLFSQIPVINIIRYNVLSLLAGAIIQLLVTFTAFVQWSRERYEIAGGDLYLKSGVIFKKNISIKLSRISSVTLEIGPIEKRVGSGTITLNSSDFKKPLHLKSVEQSDEHFHFLSNLVEEKGGSSKKLKIKDLLRTDENHHLEFKQSLRWDFKQNKLNRDLEKSVMKTIAGFLNSEGGRLIIGASDDKKIIGLKKDYETLQRKDSDGFENHFTQVFKNMIGPAQRRFVELNFEKIDNIELCLVEVRKCDRPSYVKSNGQEEFFVRTGNTTTPLSISETQDYIKSKWIKI